MKGKSTNLIWLDLEMTGLDPDGDRIIEIASVVTNSDLEILGEGPVLAISQPENVMAAMDDWNQTTHGGTGLIDRVRDSSITEHDAEQQTLAFLKEFLPEKTSPLCGNSICQDRRFLYRSMPELEAFFHYRNLDVSTLKELAKRWKPEVAKGLVKHGKHEALADVYESIEELRFYREQFIAI